MAQTGSALLWGGRGRRFKSSQPDHFLLPGRLGTKNPLKPPLKSAEDPYVSREKLLEIVVVYFLKLIRKKRSHG